MPGPLFTSVMKYHRSLTLFALLGMLSCSALSDALQPPAPGEIRTFYIQGLECGACVYMVEHALSETKGVHSHEVVWSPDSYAIVRFDPTRLSEYELAQRVREAMPVHGTPYLPSLRLCVADFAQSASTFQAVLAKFKNQVRLEVLQHERGEVALHFPSIESDKTQPSNAASSPKRWSLGDLREALDQAGPKGRAIRYELLAEAPQR